MKFIFIILIFFFTSNCNKPKAVLICGDHICVNKTEAKQYFEENLTIEVKVINKNKKNKINLVELNLQESTEGERKVSILPKNNTNKKLKTLSKKDVLKIKDNIKNKKKQMKLVKKNITKKKDKISKNKNPNASSKVKVISKKNLYNYDNNIDICTILEKCNIDEISKYLLKKGKESSFPDITTRQ